jgi:hypothetical protein
VARHVPSHNNDGGSWRHGVVESRRKMRVVMRAHGGDAVWRHGGIISRISGVYADLNLKMAWRFDGGDDSFSVYMRCSRSVAKPDERSHFA